MKTSDKYAIGAVVFFIAAIANVFLGAYLLHITKDTWVFGPIAVTFGIVELTLFVIALTVANVSAEEAKKEESDETI